MSKLLGDCMVYTDEKGESTVIIYRHIEAIETGRRHAGRVDLDIHMLSGQLLELDVKDALAREMLDNMGLSKVPLPNADN